MEEKGGRWGEGRRGERPIGKEDDDNDDDDDDDDNAKEKKRRTRKKRRRRRRSGQGGEEKGRGKMKKVRMLGKLRRGQTEEER